MDKNVAKRGRPAQKPLVIAVDAGVLGEQDETLQGGVYTVSSQLLKKLAVLDRKNHYLLFSFSPIPKEEMIQFGSHAKNIVLPQWGWFRFWVPLALRFFHPDIFLGLSQAMPAISTPTIGFIYDVAFERFPAGYPDSYKKLSRNSRFLANNSSKLITISQYSKEEIQKEYGITEKKIIVSYPGTASIFTPEGPRFIDDRPYFLYVGALKRTKNVPLLIRAFAQFLNEYQKPYRLLLVGSPAWMDPEIKTMIQRHNLTDAVIIKGYVSATDIPQYYRGAQALIISSLYEGFGLPALEAMSCGVPVIANDIAALREIVGDSGILLGSDTEDELKKALLELATDENKRKYLCEKGLKRAQKFSWATFATRVLQEIKQLGNKHKNT